MKEDCAFIRRGGSYHLRCDALRRMECRDGKECKFYKTEEELYRERVLVANRIRKMGYSYQSVMSWRRDDEVDWGRAY